MDVITIATKFIIYIEKEKSLQVTGKSTVYENKIFDIIVQHDMV